MRDDKTASRPTQALVLLGHGSHLTPETAGAVWECVDRIRRLAVADEVTAAFWKEMPFFHQALDALLSPDITLVPFFTAEGYFTSRVIPAEIGIPAAVYTSRGRTIRYAETVGRHPALFELLVRRVDEALQELGSDPARTAVAVIGHGTSRSRRSRETAADYARRLPDRMSLEQVLAVYLDDDPGVESIYELSSAPDIVAVPLFMTAGSHVSRDIPAALGLEPEARLSRVGGRRVYYTPPVGAGDELVEMVLDLARKAGAELLAGPKPGPWSGFPQAGKEELLEWVRAERTVRFGQLLLQEGQVRVSGDAAPRDTIEEPGQLRERVRNRPFRPLATSRDLPAGWTVQPADGEALHAVVETVYPGAVADWAAHRQGRFQPGSLATTLARQQGQFRRLSEISPRERLDRSAQICSHCVRHPTWLEGRSPAAAVPCAEPCNWWLSQAAGDQDDE